jgi:hypothetical protein
MPLNTLNQTTYHYYNTIKIVNGINQLIFSDQGSGFDMDKVKDKILAYMKIS